MASHMELYSEDIEGIHVVFALNLPGCYSDGATETEALGRFPAAFASHRDWLAGNGEAVPDPSEAFAVAGRFASYTLADGYEVNAIFEPERVPPDGETLARGRRLLGYARRDLLAALQAIPNADRAKPSAEGDRSPRQIIEHVARAEWWYLSHLADVRGPCPPGDRLSWTASFEAVDAVLTAWLADVPPERLGAVTVDREEEWSIRKLLRRALWHRRTHTAELTRFA